MDSYVDYEYYSETYGGNLIPQKDFEKYSYGASLEVKNRIFNRDISLFEEKVKTATCSVAEILYNQFIQKDKINNVVNGNEKIITSEKVGDLSKTYQNVSLNEILSLSSKEEISKSIDVEIERYLLSTGLLYCGGF